MESFKSFVRNNILIISMWALAIITSTISFRYSVVFLSILVVIGMKKKNNNGNNYVLFIFLTYIIFLIFALMNSGVTAFNALWYSVLPFWAFLAGRHMGAKVNSESSYYFWLLIMVVCLTLTNFFITFIDIFQNGLINPERHLAVLVGEEEVRAVTSRTMDLSLALASICCVFYINSSYRHISRVFVIISILAFLCIIHYVSRTGIVVLSVALFVGLLFQKNKRILLFIPLAIVIVYFISKSELFILYSGRETEYSSFSTAGGRLERWQAGMQMLWQNPQGYTRTDFYSHNYWLDFGRDGGIIAAISLLLFNIAISIKAYRDIITNRSLSQFVRCLTCSFIVICFISAFTEPIHSGAPAFTWTYLAICGLLSTSPHKRFYSL